MPALCKAGGALGLRIALIGGPPGSAERAAQNLVASCPGLHVTWAYCPPFGFEFDAQESMTMVKTLNALDVDLVFVGVGAPKQEKWIDEHRQNLRVGALLGIGAAIEFAAGTLHRAPRILRRLGLEWAYRLIQQPRRLFWRYSKDLYFGLIIAKQMLAKILVKVSGDRSVR
jgi:N-acetylglucosaminyldiphosphoundecaprenol N-acetyl-beta-D-mannosaminyltransferase